MEKSAQAVDFAYLEGVLASDRAVVREVLTLFLQQADRWAAGLNSAQAGWREVAHTVKGAALGIGAHSLAEACGRAEQGDAEAAVQARAALHMAVAQIEAYLAG